MKKTILLKIIFISCLMVISYALSANTVFATENAMFPMEYLNISQGVNGTYSHQGRLAIDICGRDTGQDAFYAPFTGTIKKIYGSDNVIWLESNEPVQFADGSVDYMTIMCMHDDDISDLYVGKVIQKGEHFLTEGTAGSATGNHIHMECGKGKFTGSGWYENSYGKWCIYNGVNPWDALYLSNSTIIYNDYGYNWRYVTETDTVAPVINNFTVSNNNSSSFTLNCTANEEISRAYIIVYGPGGNSGNGFNIYDINSTSFSKVINTSDYGGTGAYEVHIYVFDDAGNSAGASTGKFSTVPITVNSYTVSNINNTSFTLNCTANEEISRAYIIVYGPGGNSGNGFNIYDINSTSFSKVINIADYGGKGEYVSHIYIFDETGNSAGASTEKFIVPTPTPSPTSTPTPSPSLTPTQTPTPTPSPTPSPSPSPTPSPTLTPSLTPVPTPTPAPTATPTPTETPAKCFKVTKYDTYADVENTATESRSAVVIIAKYNENVLEKVNFVKVTFTSGEKRTFMFDTDGNYKVFVWDTINGMFPLTV